MLTLEEIENISFRRAGLSGYKIEDVDSFVDAVIEKVRSLQRANQELETRIEQLNVQIQKHEAQADSVQDAIITAEITAKKLVRDATLKAQVILTDAQTKADNMVKDAEDKSETKLSDTDVRAEMILSNALSRSANSIDENNRIIEQQKLHIKQIQSEVTRFREALIDAYKNHIKIINTLPRAEEFRQYQEKLEESYPAAKPVTPEEVGQGIRQEADKAVEAAKKEKTQIRIEMIDEEKVREISDEIRFNTKALNELEQEKAREAEKQASEKAKAETAEDEKAEDEKTEEAKQAETEKASDEKAGAEKAEDEKTPAQTAPEEEDGRTDDGEDTASDDDGGTPDDAEEEEEFEIEDDDEDIQDVSAAVVKENTDGEENADSNADEIRAVVREENIVRAFREEPKPTSIDEIEDGVIFSSSGAEKTFEEKKNKRQQIQVKEGKGKKKKFGMLKLEEIE